MLSGKKIVKNKIKQNNFLKDLENLPAKFENIEELENYIFSDYFITSYENILNYSLQEINKFFILGDYKKAFVLSGYSCEFIKECHNKIARLQEDFSQHSNILFADITNFHMLILSKYAILSIWTGANYKKEILEYLVNIEDIFSLTPRIHPQNSNAAKERKTYSDKENEYNSLYLIGQTEIQQAQHYHTLFREEKSEIDFFKLQIEEQEKTISFILNFFNDVNIKVNNLDKHNKRIVGNHIVEKGIALTSFLLGSSELYKQLVYCDSISNVDKFKSLSDKIIEELIKSRRNDCLMLCKYTNDILAKAHTISARFYIHCSKLVANDMKSKEYLSAAYNHLLQCISTQQKKFMPDKFTELTESNINEIFNFCNLKLTASNTLNLNPAHTNSYVTTCVELTYIAFEMEWSKTSEYFALTLLNLDIDISYIQEIKNICGEENKQNIFSYIEESKESKNKKKKKKKKNKKKKKKKKNKKNNKELLVQENIALNQINTRQKEPLHDSSIDFNYRNLSLEEKESQLQSEGFKTISRHSRTPLKNESPRNKNSFFAVSKTGRAHKLHSTLYQKQIEHEEKEEEHKFTLSKIRFRNLCDVMIHKKATLLPDIIDIMENIEKIKNIKMFIVGSFSQLCASPWATRPCSLPEGMDIDFVIFGAETKDKLEETSSHMKILFPDIHQTANERLLQIRAPKMDFYFSPTVGINQNLDNCLKQDAERERDLTCGCIYIGSNGYIHDPLNGREDSNFGILRISGENPSEVLSEDPRRALRVLVKSITKNGVVIDSLKNALNTFLIDEDKLNSYEYQQSIYYFTYQMFKKLNSSTQRKEMIDLMKKYGLRRLYVGRDTKTSLPKDRLPDWIEAFNFTEDASLEDEEKVSSVNDHSFRRTLML